MNLPDKKLNEEKVLFVNKSTLINSDCAYIVIGYVIRFAKLSTRGEERPCLFLFNFDFIVKLASSAGANCYSTAFVCKKLCSK